ncbi:hypothetical protein Nepgr_000418 [Nepenthes gracilis]|uniref:Pyrroline-5-carboxylate reductase n=1 Tax=Nepenthes gracilis TaxID=150966 RepID=A0AAD3RW80_NEPGR|nr:hypothetical protein Nepgr_000418 [Nepenthes gracilis]
MNPAAMEDQRPILIIRLMSKRRTWVCFFVIVYTILLYSSWSLLYSIVSWYRSNVSSSKAPESGGWPALYASMLLGFAFGLLSMVAALAVAIPAMLVTWIAVLVLLAFCGRRRRDLVVEGKKLSAEIVGFVIKILIREGNVVAAVCAVVGYFMLVHGGGNQQAVN